MSKRKGSAAAYLLASLAVLFWSTSGSAFKLTLRYLRPQEMLLYIPPVAAAIQAAMVTRQGKWGEIRRMAGSKWAFSALVGFLNPFLYYNVLFVGYDLLLTQEATTINFLWPIVLVVLSAVVFRQRLTVKTLAALLLGFCGVLVITTKGDPASLHFRSIRGVLLMLATTVIWSVFWILNMKDERPPSVKLFLGFSFGLLFSFLLWLFFLPHRKPPLEGLLGCLWAGVFEMGLTFFLWLGALSLAEKTAHVANLIFLTPFLALFWINLAVGERILPSTLFGLALIVAGIACQKWAERSEMPRKEGVRRAT